MKPLNVLKPDVSILVKLGSLAIHIEEMFSPTGHSFDKVAIESILQDQHLRNWLNQMDQLALLPIKRNNKNAK